MYIHVCNAGWRVQALAFRQCLGLCLFEVQSNRFPDLQPVGLGSRMLGLGRRGQEAFAKPHETQTLLVMVLSGFPDHQIFGCRMLQTHIEIPKSQR